MGQQKLDWMTTIIRRIRIFRMTKTWQPFLELLSMKIMRTWKSWKCLEIAWPHFYIIQCIYIYIVHILRIYIYIISNIFCIGVPFRLSIIYIYIYHWIIIDIISNIWIMYTLHYMHSMEYKYIHISLSAGRVKSSPSRRKIWQQSWKSILHRMTMDWDLMTRPKIRS